MATDDAVQARLDEIRAKLQRRAEAQVRVQALERQNTAFFGSVTISALYSEIGFTDKQLGATEVPFLLALVDTQAAQLTAARAALKYMYVVARSGYDDYHVLGIYTTKEQAEAELKRWAESENVSNKADYPDDPQFWWKDVSDQDGAKFILGSDDLLVEAYLVNHKADYSWRIAADQAAAPSAAEEA